MFIIFSFTFVVYYAGISYMQLRFGLEIGNDTYRLTIHHHENDAHVYIDGTEQDITTKNTCKHCYTLNSHGIQFRFPRKYYIGFSVEFNFLLVQQIDFPIYYSMKFLLAVEMTLSQKVVIKPKQIAFDDMCTLPADEIDTDSIKSRSWYTIKRKSIAFDYIRKKKQLSCEGFFCIELKFIKW